MQPEVDVLILGGGCAGLSLARELAAQGARCPSVLVLEPRQRYVNDRTWCFWDSGEAPLAALARHRWQAVSVRAGGRQVDIDCGSTPYRMIEAGAFYDHALACIAANPKVRLEGGTRVIASPRRQAHAWSVETSAGMRRARIVIDTRSQGVPGDARSVLWQSFLGREIETDLPTFDPSRVMLMDFMGERSAARVAAGDGRDVSEPSDPQTIFFTYVVPTSTRRALVEVTAFGHRPIAAEHLAARLDAQVAGRAGPARPSVLRSESGILPMGLAHQAKASADGLVQAGLMHGAARPASGYAFQRIQTWAAACAGQLAAGAAPLGHAPDPVLIRAMDRLFLAVLRARPHAAPALFLRMFERTEPARLIRFLSDRASLADCCAVIGGLPASPFLLQLARAAQGGLKC